MIVKRDYQHPILVFKDVPDSWLSINYSDVAHLEVAAIDGIVESESFVGRRRFEDSVEGLSLEDCLEWTGEWIAVASSANASAISTVISDFYGLASIHYCYISTGRSRGLLAVSPSFQGLVSYLQSSGVDLDVDWSVALPHLVSPVAIFRNRSTFSSLARQIRVLHHDEMICVSPNGWSVNKRPTPTFMRSEPSYSDLIRAGMASAAKVAEAAKSNPSQDYLALSGGKDSRACLAILVKAGLANEFGYMTERPAVAKGAVNQVLSRDLALASKMVDHYDLDWFTPDSGIIEYQSVKASVKEWVATRGHRHFELGDHAAVMRDVNYTKLIGYTGEYLRGGFGKGYVEAFPKWWNACERSEHSARTDLETLFETIIPLDDLPYSMYHQAKRRFSRENVTEEPRRADDVLEDRFFDFRGRGHFGSMLYQYETQRVLQVCLLARPQFFYASKMLAESERLQGKVLFDIIEEGDPDLNALPLETGEWPSTFVTAGDTSVWEQASVERATEKYDELAKSSKKRPVANPAGRPNFLVEALELADTLTETLHKRYPDEVTALLPRVVFRAQMSNNSMAQSLVLLYTLANIVAPEKVDLKILDRTHTYKMLLEYNRGASFDGFQSTPSESAELFSTEWKKQDVSGVTGEVVREPDGSIVAFLSDLDENTEVAAYLFVNSERTEVLNYQPQPTLNFDTKIEDFDDSTVEVRVFLRPKGKEGFVQRVFSI